MSNTSKILIGLGSVVTIALVVQGVRFAMMLPKLEKYVDIVKSGGEPDSQEFRGVSNDLMNGVIYRANVHHFPFSKTIIIKENIK